METAIERTANSETSVEAIRSELTKTRSSKSRRATQKFVAAALGAIPWVGGFAAAAAEFGSEESATRADDLRTNWLEEHQKKLDELHKTLEEINKRFDDFGPEVDARIESPEYLSLVRQAFRTWDQAETEDKRRYIANLLTNCAGTRICSDDVVRLFASWIEAYHENHFAVISAIHQNPGSTRFDIWAGVYGDGDLPRDNSAEADLFKMLIRDLSTGGVIRQAVDSTEAGELLNRRPPKRRGAARATKKSAFDDVEPYVLTELGKQFVHYTLMGNVRKLESQHG